MSNKIFLHGEINGWRATDFLYTLAEKERHYQEITVEINSVGGTVVEAYPIFSAILNSPANIRTHIVGIAASAASWIALAGRKITMNDFAVQMWHESNHAQADDRTKKALSAFNESIVEIYSKRTGKDKDEIRAFMKKETWFDASKCLENGLIDEIIITGKQRPEEVQNMLSDITNGPANIGAVYNSFTQFLNLNNQMLDKIANILNVSEAGVLGAIENALTENKALKADNAALKISSESFKAQAEEAQNKINQIEAERVAALAVEAEAAVNAAIEAKKLSSDAKNEWIELYKSSPATVKNALAGLPSNPKLTEYVQNTDGQAPAEPTEFKARGAANIMRDIQNRTKAQ